MFLLLIIKKLSFPQATRTKSITVAYLFFISNWSKKWDFFRKTFITVLYAWRRGNAQTTIICAKKKKQRDLFGSKNKDS